MDNKKDNPSFLSLVPTSEAKDIEAYQQAIEWAVKEKNINNIAITGGYGSGKSSILKSVVKNLEEKGEFKDKIVEISLANFKNDIIIDKEEIEKKVLNQLFYQKSNKTLPHSRFTKISFLTNEQRKKSSYYLVVYLILLVIDLHVFLKGDITKFFSMLFQPYISEISTEKCLNIIAETLPRFFHLLFIILNLIVIQKIFYVLLGKVSSINFKKVNITKNNINAEADFEKNILNDHLDELLYFFQKTGHTVVIFEDLDRYNKPGIFSDLREINEILNRYEDIKEKEIKFIYALKDSMFSEEERTKFFDFIIPILPYTTSSNFVEKFEYECSQHGNSECFQSINSELLKELSIYDLNMRQIKNLINETVIYYKTLDTEIDINKLLVFIFYKNMYPEDYEQFQSDKGVLATILNGRGWLTKLKNQEISEQIELYEKESSNTLAENLEELVAIIINKILKGVSNSVNLVRINNNSNKRIENIVFEELEEIISSQSIELSKEGYGFQTFEISNQIIEEFISKLNFINRMQNERNLKIKELKRELNEIQAELLKNLVSMENIIKLLKQENLINQQFDELPEKSKNQIIFICKFIQEGYLVEQYWSYKNKFKIGNLDKVDHDYLVKVMDWNPGVNVIPMDYVITNQKEIIKSLPKRCFKTGAVLNFKLVSFLLQNQTNEFLEQTNDLVNVLINESKETLLFIEEYLDYEHEGYRELITILWKKWGKLPEFIEQTSNEQLRTLLLKNIYLALDSEDYTLNHNFQILIEYTKKNSYYLFESKLDDNKFNSFVKEFNIEFESIQLENTLDEKEKRDFGKKINYLVENNFYQINYENLQEIVNRFFDTSGEKLPYYSIISKINQINMEYIDSHINQYIDAVYTHDISLIEDEIVYIKLLNQLFSTEKEVSDLVITFINNLKKSNVKISDLGGIEDDSLKIELFNKEIMTTSWENIILIFSFEEEIKELFNYLNKKEVCDCLIQLKIPDPDGDELIMAIMESNDLSDDIYDKYVQVFSENSWINLDIKDLDYKKKQSLIHSNVLDYDYSYVKKLDDENLLLEFVELNANDFIADLDNYDTKFINKNLDFFISNKTFTQKQKIRICKYLDSKSYTIGDLNIIKVEEFAEFIHGTLDEEQWNVEWIERLLMSTGVSDVTKIKLFNRCVVSVDDTPKFINNFVKNMKSEMLQEIGKPRKIPKISKTVENEEFVKYLERAGIISSYRIIPDKNLIKINNWKNIKN